MLSDRIYMRKPVAFGGTRGSLVVDRQETLCLAERFEPVHDLFSSSAVPVRRCNPSFQTLVLAMLYPGASSARAAL